jgi:hypothetical protein
MRLKSKFCGLLCLFMVNVSAVYAGPLIRGYFVEKLPEKATSKTLASDKGIVLAHIFNHDKHNMMPGSYKVGVEIINKNGGKKTYVVAPNEAVETGMMKTFRLAIPIADVDKNNGKFRVFSRVGENAQWSEAYSFLPNIQMDGDRQVTTLYVEAPPVEAPLKKVALQSKPAAPVFEKIQLESILKDEQVYQANSKKNEKNRKKTRVGAPAVAAVVATTAASNTAKTTVSTAANTAKVAVASAKTSGAAAKQANTQKARESLSKQKVAVANSKEKVAEKIAKVEAPQPKVAKPEVVKADVVVSKVTRINPNEFKKLKTIDEELIIYVIKEGDTLKSIASKYYGNPSKERAIADLNFIELTSSIKVGEEIIVDVRPLTKS